MYNVWDAVVMDLNDRHSNGGGTFPTDSRILPRPCFCFVLGVFCDLRKRARYCSVSRIMVSTQKGWLLLMPSVSRVFSVSCLLL